MFPAGWDGRARPGAAGDRPAAGDHHAQEAIVLAVLAAIAFALSLIFEWADLAVGDFLTSGTWVTIGLLLLALHLAGVGAGYRPWTRRRR